MEDMQLNGQAVGTDTSNRVYDLSRVALVCSRETEIDLLKDALEKYGFTVRHTKEISSLKRIALPSSVDVIIVDELLFHPGIASVIRTSLIADRPGILVRCGSNDGTDRIFALDMGADDCVDGSCSVREISARASAITRRTSVRSVITRGSGELEFAGWELRAKTRQLFTPKKDIINLTRTEYLILKCLLSNPKSIISRSDLFRYPDTSSSDDCPGRTIDVLVSRIRKKMTFYGNEDIIETVRGSGYRLILR